MDDGEKKTYTHTRISTHPHVCLHKKTLYIYLYLLIYFIIFSGGRLFLSRNIFVSFKGTKRVHFQIFDYKFFFLLKNKSTSYFPPQNIFRRVKICLTVQDFQHAI